MKYNNYNKLKKNYYIFKGGAIYINSANIPFLSNYEFSGNRETTGNDIYYNNESIVMQISKIHAH
jgi:hypothetical protein